MNPLKYLIVVLLGTSTLVVANPDPGPRKGPPEMDGRPDPELREGHRSGTRRGSDHAAGMMRKLDVDESGGISFEEFSASKKVESIPEDGRRRIFDRLDKNKDGKIRRNELPGGQERRKHWDPDGDGRITLEEFLKDPRLAKMPLERRREMFRRMDHDGNGILTPEDWPKRPDGSRGPRRRPSFLDPEVVEKLDQDQDGSLSFEEWMRHPRLKGSEKQRIREMFDRMDRNKDGKLGPEDRPERPPHRRSGPREARPEVKGGPDNKGGSEVKGEPKGERPRRRGRKSESGDEESREDG